jgi:S-DNA-T family DNA segregation ATPase FtsK/SpoIIIE
MDAGARCDQIPDSTPGVAFVKVDGTREPVRVRAGYVTDDDIAATAAQFPAPGERAEGLRVVA